MTLVTLQCVLESSAHFAVRVYFTHIHLHQFCLGSPHLQVLSFPLGFFTVSEELSFESWFPVFIGPFPLSTENILDSSFLK